MFAQTSGASTFFVFVLVFGFGFWKMFSKPGQAYAATQQAKKDQRVRATGKTIVLVSTLRQEIARMGDPMGRSKDDVLMYLGRPASWSALGDGGELLQWMITPAHIAIEFRDGRCVGITHRYRC